MNAANYPRLQVLVGKTIKSIHMSDAHGDVLTIDFMDGTKLAVSDYFGYEGQGHQPDELFVAINDQEL